MKRTAVAALLLVAGCFGNESTEFPPGLEPLEDNAVPPHEGDDYAEAISFADGETGDYTWVHGRGYVLAEPRAVWAALQTPELMAAVCSTDTHAIEVGTEPDYELSFQVSYEVHKVITVAWDEAWRYGTIEGTADAPELGMVRYQKVFGSTLIDILEGSIQLHDTPDPAVTELQFVEHLSGAGGSREDMQIAMQHRFDAVVATMHAAEQPTCP